MSDDFKQRAERALLGRYEAEGNNVFDCLAGDYPVATNSEYEARIIAIAMNEADKRAMPKAKT